MLNHSPWLDFDRTEWPTLKKDLSCEVVVVGAGISGVSTLYYLVTTTSKNVVLIEKNRIASGATGHNAGLAVIHLEKPASELVETVGKEGVMKIFEELEEAWTNLHSIQKEIGLDNNFITFPHAANGFNELSEFIAFVREAQIRAECSQATWRYLVSEEFKKEIPADLAETIEYVPHQAVLETLKTIDKSYIGAVLISAFKAGRMNSALFCCKVVDYLKENFPDRFSVYESTDITRIDLFKNHSVLLHAHGKITGEEVILCTNGYTNFTIWDQINQRAFTRLHDSITPRIGFLAAYSSPSPERYALGFLNHDGAYEKVPFWYFSNAPHPLHNPNHACVIGGPEFDRDDSYCTQWEEAKEKESLDLTKHFLKTTFKDAPDTFPFFWHGWMGYTADGLRWVGPDADHPHLWYNLACNGIGIVPAIAGGKRIAELLSGTNKKD
jgi:glycine/D-amino acid oxidase-like deaminating enzyme